MRWAKIVLMSRYRLFGKRYLYTEKQKIDSPTIFTISLKII